MLNFYNKTEKLLEKIQIAETTYLFKYSIDKSFSFVPGQYVGIQTTPTHRRAYSIFKTDEDGIWFLIDTIPGGIASQYFEQVQVGAENLIVGPYGRFTLKPSVNKKVFISTGTGIAPFYPMVEQIKNSNEMENVQIDFLFGCRFFENEVSYEYFEPFINQNFRYIQCITKEENSDTTRFPSALFFNGRVTKFLQENLINYSKSDEFYICGNPEMVEDVKTMLLIKGYSNVFGEKY